MVTKSRWVANLKATDEGFDEPSATQALFHFIPRKTVGQLTIVLYIRLYINYSAEAAIER